MRPTDRSEYMMNTELKILRTSIPAHVRRDSIRWPSCLKLSSVLEDSKSIYRLFLSADAVTRNMQSDAAAFEGWALVLKAWLACEREFGLELGWQAPGQLEPGSTQSGHYQRFLYRVIRFAESVNWFSVAQDSRPYLLESKLLHPDGKEKNGPFYLNSGDPNARKPQEISCVLTPEEFASLDEHAAERLFCVQQQALLSCISAPSGAMLERQLPVGIFQGRVAKEKTLCSRGKSAIDLWAASEGRAMLFELKRPIGNKRVGALSELMFYAHVVRDLQRDVFSFEKPSDKELVLKNQKRVEAYLLLGEGNLHPLIDNQKVFSELNDSFKSRNCQFGCIFYNASKGLLSCSRRF